MPFISAFPLSTPRRRRGASRSSCHQTTTRAVAPPANPFPASPSPASPSPPRSTPSTSLPFNSAPSETSASPTAPAALDSDSSTTAPLDRHLDRNSADAADPLQQTYETLRSTIDTAFNIFYAPLPTLLPPLTRPFHKTATSNYILHPTVPPKAVIHFLGGAFFGAVPHLLYHTLLTKLCARGYVIVATPYEISFDYLPLTERICSAWESVETDLAARYGPLPVIGLGHSAGCLFHTLSSCLFEELSPRAGLALISFNNRQAVDAIPAYATTVAPLSRAAVALRSGLPAPTREWLHRLPDLVEQLVSGPLAPRALLRDVLPTAREARRFVEQISPLFQEIASSTAVPQFYPNPEDVRNAVEALYPVEQTLVVQFQGDSLDDSPAIADAVRRRGAEVSVVELKGTHVTPLAQEPSLDGVPGLFAEMVAGVSVGELERLIKVVDEWVDAGLANDRF